MYIYNNSLDAVENFCKLKQVFPLVQAALEAAHEKSQYSQSKQMLDEILKKIVAGDHDEDLLQGIEAVLQKLYVAFLYVYISYF